MTSGALIYMAAITVMDRKDNEPFSLSRLLSKSVSIREAIDEEGCGAAFAALESEEDYANTEN